MKISLGVYLRLSKRKLRNCKVHLSICQFVHSSICPKTKALDVLWCLPEESRLLTVEVCDGWPGHRVTTSSSPVNPSGWCSSNPFTKEPGPSGRRDDVVKTWNCSRSLQTGLGQRSPSDWLRFYHKIKAVFCFVLVFFLLFLSVCVCVSVSWPHTRTHTHTQRLLLN